MPKKGMKYDYKEAYNKNLKPSARLHYLENARHDQDSGSPNKFLGGIVGAERGGALNRFLQTQQTASATPPMPVAPTADMSITGDNTVGMTGFDPNQKFQITPVQMSYDSPTPANMKGNAKPLFNPAVQASAEAIYGTPLQRQMSVPGAPVFLKEVPEGDEGAGLRKLPNDVVEKMGYDAATKMVSPLNDNHPQYFTGNREVTKQEFDSINKAKKAKTYLGGGQGLIPDFLTGGKPTRQFLNESKLFNPTTTKEKVADLNDTKMMNAYGGNSVTGNTNNKMYQHYKDKKKQIRPNRTDRY